MRRRFTLAAAAFAVLAGGTAVQAQHGHSHGHVSGHGGYTHGGYGYSGHGHGGHVHGGYGYGYSGHVHGHALPLGGYYGPYGVGPSYAYRPTLSYPVYSYPPVVTAAGVQPAVAVSPTVIPATGVTTTTSLKPNAIPPYTGPGVTLRLPADYPGAVYVQVDKREVEIKPGTEVRPGCWRRPTSAWSITPRSKSTPTTPGITCSARTGSST